MKNGGNRAWIAIACATGAVYLIAVLCGLRVHRMSLPEYPPHRQSLTPWSPPRWADLPAGVAGEDVRAGGLLFNETPLYATAHVRARLSCASCHAEGGTQPFASPMVGVPGTFPQFSERAKRNISLEDRIEECFVRSENGSPIATDGREMRQIKAYIDWISTSRTGQRKFTGKGLVKLPDLIPDPEHGAAIYAAQCAGCHGDRGQGRWPIAPPLWGVESFNDGAGMHTVRKMAAFVQHNMPQNRMGTLSPQDAYDVAGFIHQQPRPSFNPAYAKF